MANEVAFAVGGVLIEQTISAALQSILQSEQSDQAKAMNALETLANTLKNGVEQHSRLFFRVDRELAYKACNSVAVEELHECYFKRCRFQESDGRTQNWGGISVVYERKGMGKTLATLSLLTMKHGRAPKRGIYFGGATVYRSGDAYYQSLLNDGLGNEKLALDPSIFSPRTLAKIILDAVPVSLSDLNPSPSGFVEIPGVRDYFKTQFRVPGGSPVIVFEDVNIHLVEPDPQLPAEAQKHQLQMQMGNACDFFDELMNRGYERGNIIFVTTSSLLVAKFFQSLNDGSKSKMFKELKDTENYTCQRFGWTPEKRLELLKLWNEERTYGVALPEQYLEELAQNSFAQGSSIRDMNQQMINLNWNRLEIGPAASTRTHESIAGEYTCGSCVIL